MNMNGTVTVERMSAVSVDIIKGLQYVSVAGAFIQSIREIWIWKTETIEEEFSAYMMGVRRRGFPRLARLHLSAWLWILRHCRSPLLTEWLLAVLDVILPPLLIYRGWDDLD